MNDIYLKYVLPQNYRHAQQTDLDDLGYVSAIDSFGSPKTLDHHSHHHLSNSFSCTVNSIFQNFGFGAIYS